MSAIDTRALQRSPPAAVPFYHGLLNVAVAALAMTATLPGRTFGLGLIAEPLKADFHITGVRFTTLNFWAVILGSALCLPVGRMIDRVGTRLVLAVVAAALGAVVWVMSWVADEWLLFVTLTLVRGLGQGALSVVSLAVIGKWFTRGLGPAMGVFTVLLTIGFIGGTVGLDQAVHAFGWSAAWGATGLILIFGLAPTGWFLVRQTPVLPEPGAGTGESGPAELGPVATSLTLAEALRTPAFWAFTLATSWFNLTFSAVTLSNQAILEGHGFHGKIFVLVLALLTVSGLPSNLLGGWLAQRVPMGRLLAAGMAVLAASLLAFPALFSVPAVVAYALVLGVSGGLITVVFFAVYPRVFGRAHLGLVQGAAQVVSVFASASGPLLLEWSRDWTGSYDLFFWVAAAVAGILGLAAWWAPMPRPATIGGGGGVRQ